MPIESQGHKSAGQWPCSEVSSRSAGVHPETPDGNRLFGVPITALDGIRGGKAERLEFPLVIKAQQSGCITSEDFFNRFGREGQCCNSLEIALDVNDPFEIELTAR
jgi:hypothetical protein